MKLKPMSIRLWAIALLLAFTVSLSGVSSMVRAQDAPPKKNFIQKHRKATSLAAGVAAYKAAKITGNKRAAHGRKKNFAQRHPIMTGIAAGMATNHMIKKSEKKHQ